MAHTLEFHQRKTPNQMNTYSYPLSHFDLPIFFITKEKAVGETTLGEFISKWYEGDPARAWYVHENEHAVIGTKWEVRERDSRKLSGYRLIATFDTEEEANTYHLNGLYWNFCEGDMATEAPYNDHTREDVDAEIKRLNVDAPAA